MSAYQIQFLLFIDMLDPYLREFEILNFKCLRVLSEPDFSPSNRNLMFIY